jgi:hypothetical protein
MTKLATVTVGAGGQATVTFSNIPQSYTDLRIVFSARDTSNSGSQWAGASLTFNGITTGYASKVIYGSNGGTGNAPGGTTSINYLYATSSIATTSTFADTEVYISNYSSPLYKQVRAETATEHNTSATFLGFVTGTWSNTSAITSLTLTASGSFAQHSTFTLYGVKAMRQAAGNSIKATGGAISFDGTYVTHTFNTSGSFTPAQPILADYLVVAGGGGGAAGGGGAGGLRCTVGATGGGGTVESRLSLTAQSYTVTIGAGGAGVTANSTQGSDGSNSVFSSITSTGGGGGGAGGGGTTAGRTGGSGGGGGAFVGGSSFAGGSGTSNQGYAGGTGRPTSTAGAAGGGGAGAVGSNGNDSGSVENGGNGGSGFTTYINGLSVVYAGGGGGAAGTGGTGGTATGGGGGAGTNASSGGTAGTANTGGGGGGRGGNTTSQSSGAGGSGVVIIRYKG